MRKIFKIILFTLVLLVILAVASSSLIILDVAGNLASDSKTLPHGSAIGKALVVYNPGLTGGAKDIATKIGYNLQDAGYEVILAGVKSSTAANTTGYSVIVVGGPIYAGKPTSTVQAYLNSLNPPTNAKVGAFGYGSIKIDDADSVAVRQEVALLPNDSTLTLNAAIKVASGDDVDSKCQEFVTNLLS